MYNKGIVEISLNVSQGKKVFSIKNTGKGIPQDKIEHIFDRFYRVEDSRSRETGGTGLGLAICKSIVELHNGKITPKSEENKFTEFNIYFN